MKPVMLGPNQPARFYQGGARIAAFWGGAQQDGGRPEDWVASTTTLFGEPTAWLAYYAESLAGVERDFRSLKSIDLDLRSIHHYTETRVRAHVLL